VHSTLISSDITSKINRDGFAVVQDVVSLADVQRLTELLEAAGRSDGIARRGGILGIRNLLETVPEIVGLARDRRLRNIAEAVLGPDCVAVRGIMFDKTPETNWKVSWHQDLTIAVKHRADVAGFGPWSIKAGVDSVQPPAEILDQMITIRLNLDDCGEDNGPVRVIAGSHQTGRLGASDISSWRARGVEVSTVAPSGAALVMRPLLLHASSPATSPRHRRVVHLDYAIPQLPGGLEWHVAV
jgi:ectoine hydroxylase-related dioxygenase (phytanoyl-CoA dioxygenase family)